MRITRGAYFNDNIKCSIYDYMRLRAYGLTKWLANRDIVPCFRYDREGGRINSWRNKINVLKFGTYLILRLKTFIVQYRNAVYVSWSSNYYWGDL